MSGRVFLFGRESDFSHIGIVAPEITPRHVPSSDRVGLRPSGGRQRIGMAVSALSGYMPVVSLKTHHTMVSINIPIMQYGPNSVL